MLQVRSVDAAQTLRHGSWKCASRRCPTLRVIRSKSDASLVMQFEMFLKVLSPSWKVIFRCAEFLGLSSGFVRLNVSACSSPSESLHL